MRIIFWKFWNNVKSGVLVPIMPSGRSTCKWESFLGSSEITLIQECWSKLCLLDVLKVNESRFREVLKPHQNRSFGRNNAFLLYSKVPPQQPTSMSRFLKRYPRLLSLFPNFMDYDFEFLYYHCDILYLSLFVLLNNVLCIQFSNK